MLKLTSRMGSLLRPAAQCTACRAPSASVREIHVEAHLERIGVKLPVAIVPPQGSYVVGYQTGKILYISGHIPMTPEGVLLTGTVGDNMSEEDAAAAARLIALNMLATLKHQLGDLDRVARIVKLNGYVQCVDGFTGQAKVVNGASDLLAEAKVVNGASDLLAEFLSRSYAPVRPRVPKGVRCLRAARGLIGFSEC
eukprot:jgi/Undpi1/2671/HiC_scaffold_13.g06049.m1